MLRIIPSMLLVAVLGWVVWPASNWGVAGDKEEKTPSAKESASKLIYPGARRFWDEYSGAGIYTARYTSNDDFRKVAAWYKAKIEFDGVEGISINRGMVAGIRTSVIDNSRQPGPSDREQGEKRPVEVIVCFRKTDEWIINAVLTREKTERETHIVLTVMNTKAR